LSPGEELMASVDAQNHYGTLTPEVPNTKYFLTTEEFDKAVGKDFIKSANRTLEKGRKIYGWPVAWQIPGRCLPIHI